MFIPQNNPFNIFFDGWDEDKIDIPDIMKSKAGLLCIFWYTFAQKWSLNMHIHILQYYICKIKHIQYTLKDSGTLG